jgi:hypothetical protein
MGSLRVKNVSKKFSRLGTFNVESFNIESHVVSNHSTAKIINSRIFETSQVIQFDNKINGRYRLTSHLSTVHFPAEGSKYPLRGDTITDRVFENKCVQQGIDAGNWQSETKRNKERNKGLYPAWNKKIRENNCLFALIMLTLLLKTIPGWNGS